MVVPGGRSPHRHHLVGTLVQRFNDVAMVVRAVATLAQCQQVFFNGAQFGQTLAHLAQVRVQRGAGGGAIGLLNEFQRQQGAYRVQRHVQRAALPNEAQTVHIDIAVQPVAVAGTGLGACAAADVGGAHARAPDGFANAVLRHCGYRRCWPTRAWPFCCVRFAPATPTIRSVWRCSRKDALSNLAVMAAALGVLGTGAAWPYLAVAAVMAVLALTAGLSVVRQARAELAQGSANRPAEAPQTVGMPHTH